MGKGDSSRRRICRCPGPEKQEGGLALEPESLRGGGDEVRKLARPFLLYKTLLRHFLHIINFHPPILELFLRRLGFTEQ